MKYVYNFQEGNKELKPLLGGKGANLAEMNKIGLPVPDGFTITTDACNQYYEDKQIMNDIMKKEIMNHLESLERRTNKKLGDIDNPLLVSVRSGAVISMPGMMDTVLNLGLNDESVQGLARLTENPRFAYDCYRRFIQMFADVVLEIQKHYFEDQLTKIKNKNNYKNDTELTVDDLKILIEKYKLIVKKESKIDFPQEPIQQLIMSIKAVFDSWNNPRAIIYREHNDIPSELGTAVNIQSMVFGNMGDTSGTGVAFTRNPSTGENKLFGEFLINAQGEDVVAGIRTPKDINELKDILPQVYDDFVKITHLLEKHYKDVQDIEFTVERGQLFLLQTRTAKRTALAAVNIAVAMVQEKLIDKKEALLRIDPKQVSQLLHPTFIKEDLDTAKYIAKGLPASPGAATGKIYFNSEDIVQAVKNNEKAILVRTETSPEDIEGMVNAEGILTSRGGMTSHAAVVARGMGKCCVAGCGEVHVDEASKIFKVGTTVYEEGDYISLDGNKGIIYEGKIKTSKPSVTGNFAKILKWADDFRVLGVRTNADNPRDTKKAIEYGAEGIGLCRTEHMFFDDERITTVRKMIIAEDKAERVKALEDLQPYQEKDFKEIFEIMEGRPVTVRLLDPPLHEFLPSESEEIKNLSSRIGCDYKELKNKIDELKEFNPMLGHRGCRLAITYPEIYIMQVRAIFNAVCQVAKKGIDVKPQVMIPLIGHLKEFKLLKDIVIKEANQILNSNNIDIAYKVGTMIEVPRAALVADEIAQEADFFSFGTNDLTQMTLGFSRDDSGRFIAEYRKQGIFEKDPFESVDQNGVGKLMKMSVDLGRNTKEHLKVGICGEQGGEAKSIDFCHKIGLDYVSCSPYRVPVARVAAAQSAIKSK